MVPPNWGYVWGHSDDPRIVRAHQWTDALRSARPTVVESPAGGDGVALAYAGLPDGLTHVLPFLEERRGPAGNRRSRTTTWTAIAKGHAAPEADILAAGCLPGRAAALPRERSLLLPFRVNLVVPATADPAAAQRRLSRKARQQYAREQRRLARTFEVAADEADFDFFYDRMHAPTMRRRHGDAARSVDRETARRCLFGRGVLFFLCEEGTRVAGLLCRREPGSLTIRLAGVLDGADRLYQSGTYLALYVLTIEWASRNGVATVDLSGCEPFLSKGIFQFKRKLHPQIVPPKNHFARKRLWLHVRRDRPAVRDFLVANPLLLPADGGGLTALYFHDRDRPAQLGLRWQCPGVAGHLLADLDAFFAGEWRAERFASEW
ncbi:GNAT family N-acetyltransferase [Spirillospora sp. CA-294931]|uniref:GNAT family N-acetyltransferase n=1 Tax=Spirillospora sp. CA-294931 TaxID=3240042 RepID=UPI003D8EA937